MTTKNTTTTEKPKLKRNKKRLSKRPTKAKTNIKKDLPEVKSEDIDSLAKTILAEREEDRIKEEKIIEPVIEDTHYSTYEEVAPETEPVITEVAKIDITVGTSARDLIVINKDREVANFLDNVFGSANGSYFIIGDNTRWSIIQGARKKVRCMFIEDANGFKYNIWFDISATSFIR